MKKILMVVALATFTMGAVNAKGNMGDKKMEKKMAMKEHVCNKECTKDKCNMKHGEKGHTCTAECKKMMDKK
ncbi:MAG: hypothetical protein RI955_1787 [Bacteroidota bacterium]|jgi:hypothetical protein